MQPISTLQQASAAETRSGGGPLEHPDDWAAEIALIVAMTMEPSCVFSFCFAKRGGAATELGTQGASKLM